MGTLHRPSLPKVLAVVVPTMETGGAERQVLSLMKCLDASLWRPVLICLHGRGALFDEARTAGIESFCLESSGRVHLVAFLKLVRLLSASGASAVLSRGFSATTLGRIAALLAGIRISLVAEHSAQDIRPRGWLKWLTDAVLAAWTNAWVVVSTEQIPYVVSRKGAAEERIHVIPNGVDFEELHYGSRERARHLLAVPSDAFVIGTVTVLRPEKDHRTMIEAFSLFASRVESAMLVIIGGGPSADDVNQWVTEHGLGNRVLLTGERSDVGMLLPAFDVFTLTSVTEAMPMSVVEAMGAGIPIVASEVGGIPELVQYGRSGVLIAPGDVSGFSDAWELLLKPEVADSFGAAATKRGRRFSAQGMARAYERLLGELLRQSRVSESGRNAV